MHIPGTHMVPIMKLPIHIDIWFRVHLEDLGADKLLMTYGTGGLIQYSQDSQGLSKNPYPESNQPNSLY